MKENQPSTYKSLPNIGNCNFFEKAESPFYIIEGVGGNSNTTSTKMLVQKSGSAFYDVNPGFGKLKIINSTHIKYEHINSLNGQLIDCVYYRKLEIIEIKNEGTNTGLLILFLVLGFILMIILIGVAYWWFKKRKNSFSLESKLIDLENK